MAGLDFSAATNALKEFYLPGSREQLNNDIPLLQQIERNTEDVQGLEAYIVPHVSRNSGVGARPDFGTLPAAGAQGYAVEKIPLQRNYGRITVSGPTIKAMASDKGSFVRAVDSEMRGVTNDLKRDVSRQIWGNGDSKIATCGTTTTTNVITLAAATTGVQMRFFQVGDRVDIGTAAAPTTIIANAKVTAVSASSSPPTITVLAADGSTPSLSTTGSHFVFRTGSAGVSVSYELTGLQKIVAATGALHNVDPANSPIWAAYLDSSGGSLNENAMAKAVMGIQIACGDYPDLAVASDGVYRAYGALLTSLKRFPQTTQLKGGYSGLDFTASGPTIKVVWDRDCPAKSLFWLNTSHLAEYRMADWEWMDQDGAVLSRVSGVDAYEATLFMYHELGTDQRNSHGLQSAITEA